jgi:hypothetical protein
LLIVSFVINTCCSDLLSAETDHKTATFILNTIREEEQQTELLKRASSTMLTIAAADAVDSKDVAAEQSYNREQVQEQEQVSVSVVWWLC